MAKIEPFEKFSNEYDKWFDDHMDFYQAELKTILKLMPAKGTKGMEVGVGSGKFAAPLGIKIGVEPSKKMADKARKQGIDVYPGIAEALPFSDDRFDFVLMITTICFVDDVAKSLKEVCRVLKTNGYIIVGFVDRESELGKQYSKKKENSKFYKDASFYSATEVVAYLENSGFTITDILQTLIPGQLPDTILEGFGQGSFVAVKGIKKMD